MNHNKALEASRYNPMQEPMPMELFDQHWPPPSLLSMRHSTCTAVEKEGAKHQNQLQQNWALAHQGICTVHLLWSISLGGTCCDWWLAVVTGGWLIPYRSARVESPCSDSFCALCVKISESGLDTWPELLLPIFHEVNIESILAQLEKISEPKANSNRLLE